MAWTPPSARSSAPSSATARSPTARYSARPAVPGVIRRTSPRKCLRDARRCSHTNAPTNPSAPVTAIRSDPLPAMLVVETEHGTHEPVDVPPALARGAAAVVNDAHRRHVRGRRHAGQPDAPVVILEIE